MYRGVLNIGWKDWVSNREVLERIGMGMHLFSSIEKGKAAFFGHICRESGGNDIVAILEKSIDGMDQEELREENGQRT